VTKHKPPRLGRGGGGGGAKKLRGTRVEASEGGGDGKERVLGETKVIELSPRTLMNCAPESNGGALCKNLRRQRIFP